MSLSDCDDDEDDVFVKVINGLSNTVSLSVFGLILRYCSAASDNDVLFGVEREAEMQKKPLRS